MKKLNKFLVAGLLSLVSLISLAGVTAGGYSGDDSEIGDIVTKVRVDNNGKGYIEFSSPIESPATCVSSFLNQLSFDATTSGGKAIMQTALTAKVTGRKLVAIGSNACSHYSVIESLQNAIIQ